MKIWAITIIIYWVGYLVASLGICVRIKKLFPNSEDFKYSASSIASRKAKNVRVIVLSIIPFVNALIGIIFIFGSFSNTAIEAWIDHNTTDY